MLKTAVLFKKRQFGVKNAIDIYLVIEMNVY